MSIRSILVPNTHKLELEEVLGPALALARPLKAHVAVLHISPSYPAIEENIPTESGVDARTLYEMLRRSTSTAKVRFEGWCARNQLEHHPKEHYLASTFARWSEAEGEVEPLVARAGRLADLIVVRKPNPAVLQTGRCFDAAVFAAGRPTLIPAESPLEDPLRQVLVAWNGSLEAMHAVAMTLDLLHEARNVSIFSAVSARGLGDVAVELASALRWHGIEAKRAPAASSGGVAESLLETAETTRASLIVMGGYTHSRIRETLLGGVTHHVLAHARLPVILTH